MAQQLQKAALRIRQLEGEYRKQEERAKELEARLQERDLRVAALENQCAAGGAAQLRKAPAAAAPVDSSPITSEPELEETLKRLVTRIAMILQAERCVFLLHDQRTEELFAHRPAFGIPDDQVRLFRIHEGDGISGTVFRSGKPLIVDDLAHDPRAEQWVVKLLGARNCASVPLMVEKRDEENRVSERRCIGVLHVFDKRYGGRFAEEDIHLLGVLSRNAAAVIANAKLFFEVVDEKNKMEATLESLTAGLILVGTNGKIMLMNPSAEMMLGLSGRQEVGKPFASVVANAHVREMLQLALTSNQEVAREEVTLMHPDPDSSEDREHIYHAQTALVKSADTGELLGAALILNDITEFRNVERMKSAFIATVSHELNTPLTAIKGFIATLRQDADEFYDKHTRQEFYQIIDAECDRLSRLIGNLLSLSRIESGHALELELQQVDVGAVVERVAAAQRAYTKNHTIVTQVFPGLPPLLADEAKIDQILTNLVSNAVKFSPNGGEVRIQVQPDDGCVQFSVSDQGIGIPREHLPRIFERFHRVDVRDTRDTYGAGIGLYLVKHLVEAHNGTVAVESEVGRGTRFTFRIPVSQPQT